LGYSGVAREAGLDSLVEVYRSTCSFNSLLLSFGQCLDMAIHGVLVEKESAFARLEGRVTDGGVPLALEALRK
jgi:hypothetical protein